MDDTHLITAPFTGSSAVTYCHHEEGVWGGGCPALGPDVTRCPTILIVLLYGYRIDLIRKIPELDLAHVSNKHSLNTDAD